MGSSGLRAARLGVSVAALILAVSFIQELFAWGALSVSDVGTSMAVAGLAQGLVSGLAVVALVHSPAWPARRNHKLHG